MSPAIIAGFVIEDSVPIPTGRGTKNPVRQAMEALAVGQSFIAPKVHAAAVHGIAKLLKPKRFQTATRTVGGEVSTRIWRIE